MDNADEIKVFLEDYPNPSIVTTSTVKDNVAVCIRPVPSLFGPELMCNHKSKNNLIMFLKENGAKK